MSFNASKTKCVIFRPRHNLAGAKSVFPSFCISDCDIEPVDQWCHLGHVISSSSL